MKQKDLKIALGVVSPFVGARSIIPTLTTIYVDSNNEMLSFRATNLDMTASVSVQNDFVGDEMSDAKPTMWAGCAPAKTLTELIAGMDSNVNFDFNRKTLTLAVSGNGSKANIKCMPGTDFPPLPVVLNPLIINLSGKVLSELRRKVLWASSDNEARPVLAGVYIYVDNSIAHFETSDGFRLCRFKAYIEASEKGAAIIPTDALETVLRMIGDKDASMQIGTNGTVVFVIENAQFWITQLEGKFPDLGQIIDPVMRAVKTTVVCKATDLAHALLQARIFARQGKYISRFNVTPEGLTVSAVSEETGSTTATIAAVVTGPAIEVGLNVEFALDAARAVDGEVVLEFSDTKSPVIVRQKDESNWISLLMPMLLE